MIKRFLNLLTIGYNMNIGFAGLLAIVFITLKLLDVIAWSWVWVLAPIWMSVLLWFALLFLVLWSNGSINLYLKRNKK